MTAIDANCDVVVVGGGLLGLATAMALSARGRRVAVLEAEERVAVHQSGHNSGVIHSGLYYKPGSLKATLCVEGARALHRFCDEEGIAHQRCGKLVVATSPDELPRLDELERRGAGQRPRRRAPAGGRGDPRDRAPRRRHRRPPRAGDGDRRLSGGGARLRPPDRGGGRPGAHRRPPARGAAGRPRAGRRDRARRLLPPACWSTARACRRTAWRASAAPTPDVRIFPFRGEYYDLAPERRSLVRGLIYPVPDPRFPFLGVHLTRRVDGSVEAGPNAVLALKREGYRWRDVSLRDAGGIAAWPGFWRLAARFGGIGAYEVRRSLSKGLFVRDLQRLVPEIRPADVHRAGSGVRAQALDAKGGLLDDFRIVRGERAIHVLNAPSPGATASIPIGERIAAMAAGELGRSAS